LPLGTSLNPSGVTVRRYGFPLIVRFNRQGMSGSVDTKNEGEQPLFLRPNSGVF
jgi:hypothetical protein